MSTTDAVLDLKITSAATSNQCFWYVAAKQLRTVISKLSTHVTKVAVEPVDSNFCGSIEARSNGGAFSFLAFIIDFCGWAALHPILAKSDFSMTSALSRFFLRVRQLKS